MQKKLFHISKTSFLSVDFPLSDKSIFYQGGFDVIQDDVVILTGASGSGKSTFLKLLKGIIPRLIHAKVNGSILFKNTELSIIGDVELLKVGYLSQNPFNQIICDTVLNELSFGLENLKMSAKDIHDRIDCCLNEFGLFYLKHRKTNQLSGGEAQIINLISLLLLDLDILLLDEPTAFLDPRSAEQIVQMLKNRTAIVVEHNFQYFQSIATKFIYLNEENIFCERKMLENLFCKPYLDDGFEHSLSELVIERGEGCPVLDKIPRIGSFEPNILEIKNLSFSYENKKVLDNVNLTVGRGEIVGIKGVIGSGKSTLIQLILGILTSRDTIFFYNQPIESLKNTFNRIGIVWQNSDFHFFYDTVKQETNKLEEFGLSHLAMQNPFTLSEGEKKRLAIAIAFDKNVDLMLLDEPTFGQDSINTQMIKNKILEFGSSGKSILIVSHDDCFLRNICDKIYSLKNNNLKQC